MPTTSISPKKLLITAVNKKSFLDKKSAHTMRRSFVFYSELSFQIFQVEKICIHSNNGKWIITFCCMAGIAINALDFCSLGTTINGR